MTQSSPHSDVRVALVNTVKLGLSLLATWGIALVFRIFLPRWLGPEQFGLLNSADMLAATVFTTLQLGLDTYIRKEVPVRPGHADDFFYGALLVRCVLAAFLFVLLGAYLQWAGESEPMRQLLFWYGAGNFFLVLKDSLAALLHARGEVGGLSVNNVAGKVVWGLGVLAAVFVFRSLVGVAASLAVAKALESVGCWFLVQRHLSLSWRLPKWAPVKWVLLSSLPFYLNTVFHTVYNKLDVYLLSKLLSLEEAGWYGAASQLTGVAMMIAPVLGWVVLPLFARAKARSEADYWTVVRRTLEVILMLSVPISLALGLGADVWISLLSGAEFAPAVRSLRILAPIYTLIYVSMVSAMALNLENRAWTVTWISLGGTLLNPMLNVLFVAKGAEQLGSGGGGMVSAAVQFATEAAVAAVMFAIIGKRAFDRRTAKTLLRTALVCAAVLGLDFGMRGLPGLARLVLDGLAYVVLAVATGAIDVSEVKLFLQKTMRPIATE